MGIERWIGDNQTAEYPEPSETLIEFITPVTDTEALMQVCELDRAAFFVNGQLTDDADFESQFQARFLLIEGQWLWEDTIKLVFEELPEGGTPACFNESVS